MERGVKNCDWRKRILSYSSIPGLSSDGFYICNNALLFNSQDSQDGNVNSTAIALCCQCTLFNMALCLHQWGNSLKSRSNLLSAGRLYEQCLKLGDDLPGAATDAIVIKMIILNNVAHLQCSLGDVDKAIENLETIRNLLMETSIEDCVSPALPAVLQLDELVLNVLVTAVPMTACSA